MHDLLYVVHRRRGNQHRGAGWLSPAIGPVVLLQLSFAGGSAVNITIRDRPTGMAFGAPTKLAYSDKSTDTGGTLTVTDDRHAGGSRAFRLSRGREPRHRGQRSRRHAGQRRATSLTPSSGQAHLPDDLELFLVIRPIRATSKATLILRSNEKYFPPGFQHC